MVTFCEQSSEPTSLIKGTTNLDQQIDYQLLKHSPP